MQASQYSCPRGPQGPKRTTHFLFNYHLAATCLLSSIQQETLTALQKGITIRLLFGPPINFQTVADKLHSAKHVSPRTNRITPPNPMFLCSLPSPPLESLRSGGLRVVAADDEERHLLNQTLEVQKVTSYVVKLGKPSFRLTLLVTFAQDVF